MRLAAIETSTEWCSVALWLDGELVSIERRAGQRHAEMLLPMLDELLAGAGLGASALGAVAYGAGPGSFTGLRIACAAAQGIAVARDLPVLGVSTLEVIAEESGARRVFACLDARMHEVYYAAMERTADECAPWRELLPPGCTAPAEVAVPAGGGWAGCGNGFAVYGDALGRRLGAALARVQPQVRAAAAGVARLAAPRLEAGLGVDAAEAVPLYVRDKVALTVEEQRAIR